MYGLKRIEYDDFGRVQAVEFHPDITRRDIERIFDALELKHVVTEAEKTGTQSKETPFNLDKSSDERPEAK